MKPELLFMCEIKDTEAKAKIAQYAEIIEITSDKVEDILDNIAGKTGVIVPYTTHKLVTKEVVDKGTDLKLIGSTYGGTRQNIEDIYCLDKGLTVIHTGASRPRPMAEYTLGLTLSSLLFIHNYNMDMKTGDSWPRFKYNRSRILRNRKVGVIGFGQIGREIVDIFKFFTDDIAIRSNHLDEEAAAKLGLKKQSLNEMFADREIIILAGGYTPETHHMVGKEQFDLMKDDALFVNIARGKMVDQAAMIDALEAKNIYLALDVFENEPLEDKSPLRKNDRVLMTPHRANNSIEFEERWRCLADDIEKFFTGRKPDSALTIERARGMSDS